MKRLNFRINLSLAILTLGIFLGGCDNPQQRAMIRLSAINFKDKATVAIDSVRVVYQLNNPQPSDAKQLLINELLKSPNVNPRNIREIDNLIREEMISTPGRTSKVNLTLDDLQAEYVAAANMFNQLENVSTFGEIVGGGSQAINDAVEPARHLTAKMLILAYLISQNPPTPKNPDRVLLAEALRQLREQYKKPNLSDAEKKLIEAQVGEIINNWISVDNQEKVLLCTAYTNLLVAGQTGTELSNLLNNYKTLSVNQIFATLDKIFTITSPWLVGTSSQINTKVKDIKEAIDKDPELKKILDQLLQDGFGGTTQETNVFSPSNPQTLNCSS
jgi:uncharacterized membrane protein YheB (UPF0754 family)